MPVVARLRALEILDSRGRPTVRASCRLEDGSIGEASVPSGASTGKAEARELRDGDVERYDGWGCRRAVDRINRDLHEALSGVSFEDQKALDRAMIDLDGTDDKSRFGANALLAVSLAFARARAQAETIPLFEYFRRLRTDPRPLRALPRPTINLFSGGLHAGGQVSIQDVLIVPAAGTIDQVLATAFSVYEEAAALAEERYDMRRLRADEGGLAPPFNSTEEMLDGAVEAVCRAGFEPGGEVALALDVAASHFYEKDVRKYFLDGREVDGETMIETILGWVDRYPTVSIEDGLAEDDWLHWSQLQARMPDSVMVLGDDLLCTNPGRIDRALENGAANALLLKVNQIGTVTEAREAFELARASGWQITFSARSGETEDNWLADLAVGWAGEQIKIGSITQSERLSKYNRLLAIEAHTNLPVVPIGAAGHRGSTV